MWWRACTCTATPRMPSPCCSTPNPHPTALRSSAHITSARTPRSSALSPLRCWWSRATPRTATSWPPGPFPAPQRCSPTTRARWLHRSAAPSPRSMPSSPCALPRASRPSAWIPARRPSCRRLGWTPPCRLRRAATSDRKPLRGCTTAATPTGGCAASPLTGPSPWAPICERERWPRAPSRAWPRYREMAGWPSQWCDARWLMATRCRLATARLVTSSVPPHPVLL